ncbi:MAG: uracil-DNA glycosylase family protein [Methylotenera sp.]|nr:uracil-DNA glycosylase family protein [Oligoflexia bacterium]
MSVHRLRTIQQSIAACRDCPNMVGNPVYGAPVTSRIFLLGQAPGPREESYGRPFAFTAGKTLFRWFEETSGISEEHFRERVYMAAVARCYPGKAATGDRVPDRTEISNCSRHLKLELEVLQPELILAVGKLAIAQVLGPEVYTAKSKLIDVIGKKFAVTFHGRKAEVICLPHPSGLSAWHKTEPGKTLLKKALKLLSRHPAWLEEIA